MDWECHLVADSSTELVNAIDTNVRNRYRVGEGAYGQLGHDGL
jgi:hypothetical protein